MWSITMDAAEAKRAIGVCLVNAERRLSDAIRREAARVVETHRRWWTRPMFVPRIATEGDAEATIRLMLFAEDRKCRDAAAKRAGMHSGWEWHRRSELADEARTLVYFKRLSDLARMDGVTSVALTGSDAALLTRMMAGG